MEVIFLEKFEKDLDKIYDTKLNQKVIDFIEELEEANKLFEIRNVKKLKVYKNAYRVSIGDYRIGFFYENRVIELARIVHRKDIYRLFP